jgi:hypothetical protein
MGAEVIATFHERRVLPLMWRARCLDEMVPNAPLEGTVLVTGELDHEEIRKRMTTSSRWCALPTLLLLPLSLGLFAFLFA